MKTRKIQENHSRISIESCLFLPNSVSDWVIMITCIFWIEKKTTSFTMSVYILFVVTYAIQSQIIVKHF